MIKHLNQDTCIIHNILKYILNIYVYVYIYRWKDHLRLIHTAERPFDCPHCHESYRQKSAFNSHLKIKKS